MGNLADIIGTAFRKSASIKMFFKHILLIMSMRQVIITLMVAVFMGVNFWALTTGALLSGLFRKPVKKSLGVAYKHIRVNPLRRCLSITDIEIHPSTSPLFSRILLCIVPSADVTTEPPPSGLNDDVPFRGSKIRISSIVITFSAKLWWGNPLNLFVPNNNSRNDVHNQKTATNDKENKGGKDSAEIDNNNNISPPEGDIAVEVSFDNLEEGRTTETTPTIAAAPLSDPPSGRSAFVRFVNFFQKLSICGPSPCIDIHVKNMRVEVDKAYLAPLAIDGLERLTTTANTSLSPSSSAMGGDEDSEGSTTTKDCLPCASVPEELRVDNDNHPVSYPTFSINCLPWQLQVILANNFTRFIEKWLERERLNIPPSSAKQNKKDAKKNKKDGDIRDSRSSFLDKSYITTEVTDDSDIFSEMDDDTQSQASQTPSQTPSTDHPQQVAPTATDQQTLPPHSKIQEDKLHHFILTSLHTILSSFTLVVTDFALLLTGVDATTVTSARATLSHPHSASVAIASVSRKDRAMTVIGTKETRLGFEEETGDARLRFVGLFIKVGLPMKLPMTFSRMSTTTTTKFPMTGQPELAKPPSKKTSKKRHKHRIRVRRGNDYESVFDRIDERRNWHDVLSPVNSALDIDGFLSIVLFFASYDHFWYDRSGIAIKLSVDDTKLFLSPSHVHTLIAHVDDWIDPNAPLREWENWLHMEHMRCCLDNDTPIDGVFYQCLYQKYKLGRRKLTLTTSTSNVTDEEYTTTATEDVNIDKMTSKEVLTQLENLEKRMTVRDILSYRYRAMKDEWEIPRSSREFHTFLKATGSSVAVGASDTNRKICRPTPSTMRVRGGGDKSSIVNSAVISPSSSRDLYDEDDEDDGELYASALFSPPPSMEEDNMPYLARLPLQKTYKSKFEALLCLLQEKNGLLIPSHTVTVSVASCDMELQCHLKDSSSSSSTTSAGGSRGDGVITKGYGRALSGLIRKRPSGIADSTIKATTTAAQHHTTKAAHFALPDTETPVVVPTIISTSHFELVYTGRSPILASPLFDDPTTTSKITRAATSSLDNGGAASLNNVVPCLTLKMSFQRLLWFVKTSAVDLDQEGVDLPSFDDGSLMGLVFQPKREEPGPFPLFNFSLISCIAANKLKEPHLDISLSFTHIIFTIIPQPLITSLHIILQLAKLPFRDLAHERNISMFNPPSFNESSQSMVSTASPTMLRQTTSLGIDVNDDDTTVSTTDDTLSTQDCRPSNGTILNGLSAKIDVRFRHSYLILLVDQDHVEKGCVSVNLRDVFIDTSSSTLSESLKMDIDTLTIATTMVSGSTKRDEMEIHEMPFKNGFELDGLRIKYVGTSKERKKDVAVPQLMNMSHAEGETTGGVGGKENEKGIVSIMLTIFIGPHLGVNVTPTFITSLLSCWESFQPHLESLNAVFSSPDNDDDDDNNNTTQNKEMEPETKKMIKGINRLSDVLRNVWSEVDIDHSNTLNQEEVAGIITVLFESQRFDRETKGQASILTDVEFKRELMQFMDFVDPTRKNEIMFEDVMIALIHLLRTTGHCDTPLPDDLPIPSLGDDCQHSRTYKDVIAREDEIMSKGIVYYSDLREYASLVEVTKIVGILDNLHPLHFPLPSLWQNGKGVDLFWEFYERETGCTKFSLKGQETRDVQEKLVRSLCHYQFARHCWIRLVRPQLQALYEQKNKPRWDKQKKRGVVPLIAKYKWLLDTNHTPEYDFDAGVMSRLIKHVEDIAIVEEGPLEYFLYDVKVLIEMDETLLTVGNAIKFTEPLFEFKISDLNVSIATLVNPCCRNGLLKAIEVSSPVSTSPKAKKNEADAGMAKPTVTGALRAKNRTLTSSTDDSPSSSGLNFHFETCIASRYLNARLATLETFIEPFSIFGDVQYHPKDDNLDYEAADNNKKLDEAEGFSLEFKFNCPDNININASPACIHTFSLVDDMLKRSSPAKHEEMLMERHVENVRQFWNSSFGESTRRLNFSRVENLVKQFYVSPNDGLDELEMKNVVSYFMEVVDVNHDGHISFEEVKRAVFAKQLVARSFYESVSEMRVSNNTGIEIKFCSQVDFDDCREDATPEELMGRLAREFQTVAASGFRTTTINMLSESSLVLFLPSFRFIEEIHLSAYQKLIIPLKFTKKWRKKRSRNKEDRSNKTNTKSGFEPSVTIVPIADNLDTITFEIRSSFVVEAMTPIDIRVVRIVDTDKILQRKNKYAGTLSIDFTNKLFLAFLEQACEEAPIIFESRNVPLGTKVPLPLKAFTSMYHHVLLIRDINPDEEQNWRSPILLSKEFLHNPKRSSDVSRCQAKCGIVIQRDALVAHHSVNDLKKETKMGIRGGRQTANKDAARNKMKYLAKRTGWDTRIQVIPTFIMWNSLPFTVSYRVWQILKDDDDEINATVGDFSIEQLTNQHTENEDISNDGDDAYSPVKNSQFDSRASVHSERGLLPKHSQYKAFRSAFHAVSSIKSGNFVRLNGIDTNAPLLIQISKQHSDSTKAVTWTEAIKVNIGSLKIGGNKKGLLSIPKITTKLGYSDVSVDVMVNHKGTPNCTLFTHYWVVNKTGMTMEYKFSGRENVITDNGLGTTPILAECFDVNRKFGEKNELSATPVESISESTAQKWWDAEKNGELVISASPLLRRDDSIVKDLFGRVTLDAVGTYDEINARGHVFAYSLQSLTGVFHKSNLITFLPRYIFKNELRENIKILPVHSSVSDLKKMIQIWNKEEVENVSKVFAEKSNRLKSKINRLKPNQSTILYTFHEVDHASIVGSVSSKSRFVCMQVNNEDLNTQGKWHCVSVDAEQTVYYSERQGRFATICNIIMADIEKTNATTTIHILQCQRPPFVLENRSNEYYIQFIQDDSLGIPFELPPMTSCVYSWDNPLKHKKLRFVAVEHEKSMEYLLEMEKAKSLKEDKNLTEPVDDLNEPLTTVNDEEKVDSTAGNDTSIQGKESDKEDNETKHDKKEKLHLESTLNESDKGHKSQIVQSIGKQSKYFSAEITNDNSSDTEKYESKDIPENKNKKELECNQPNFEDDAHINEIEADKVIEALAMKKVEHHFGRSKTMSRASDKPSTDGSFLKEMEKDKKDIASFSQSSVESTIVNLIDKDGKMVAQLGSSDSDSNRLPSERLDFQRLDNTQTGTENDNVLKFAQMKPELVQSQFNKTSEQVVFEKKEAHHIETTNGDFEDNDLGEITTESGNIEIVHVKKELPDNKSKGMDNKNNTLHENMHKSNISDSQHGNELEKDKYPENKVFIEEGKSILRNEEDRIEKKTSVVTDVKEKKVETKKDDITSALSILNNKEDRDDSRINKDFEDMNDGYLTVSQLAGIQQNTSAASKRKIQNDNDSVQSSQYEIKDIDGKEEDVIYEDTNYMDDDFLTVSQLVVVQQSVGIDSKNVIQDKGIIEDTCDDAENITNHVEEETSKVGESHMSSALSQRDERKKSMPEDLEKAKTCGKELDEQKRDQITWPHEANQSSSNKDKQVVMATALAKNQKGTDKLMRVLGENVFQEPDLKKKDKKKLFVRKAKQLTLFKNVGSKEKLDNIKSAPTKIMKDTKHFFQDHMHIHSKAKTKENEVDESTDEETEGMKPHHSKFNIFHVGSKEKRPGDNSQQDIDADTNKKKKQFFLKYHPPKFMKSRLYQTDMKANKSVPHIQRNRLFSSRSKLIDPMQNISRQMYLPVRTPHNVKIYLFPDIRVLNGSKVLSFSDSQWRTAHREETSSSQTGAYWRNFSIGLGVEGISLNLMDDYPNELCSVNLREFSIYKSYGEVETCVKLRHVQVDAMLKTAHYPIIVQPLPLGIDPRVSSVGDSENIDKMAFPHKNFKSHSKKPNQYWEKFSDKPLPVIEAHVSYLPQPNMIWVPNATILINPLKVQIELDYLLKIIDLVLNSLPDSLASNDDDEFNDVMNVSHGLIISPMRKYTMNDLMVYVQNLIINSTWFEIEFNIRPEKDANDDEDNDEGQSMLALSAMGRTTKSALSASLITWVSNVAATFAHISPTFQYNEITKIDRYCKPGRLLMEVAQSYIFMTIKQSYKVLFSMNVIGNPTMLVGQYKKGIVDLVAITHDEVMAGGSKGFGKGFASLFQNVVGGTFSTVGKITGNAADTLSSVAHDDTTVTKFDNKPYHATETPHNILDGFRQGTLFLDRTIGNGIVGLVGNPYKGLKKKSAGAALQGVGSGIAGLMVAPFVGALGFTAKVTEGIAGTARIFEASIIESHCRLNRDVGWGCTIGRLALPYLKAIGIRVHVVRFQKKYRYRTNRGPTHDIGEKDFKNARDEERRMKNPPSKVVTATHIRTKNLYMTQASKPTLLVDDTNTESNICEYSAAFEDTIIIRLSDLQLSDTIVFHLWNRKTLYPKITKGKPCAQCTLTMADIFSSISNFHDGRQSRSRHNFSLRVPEMSTTGHVKKAQTTIVTGDMSREMRNMRAISGQTHVGDKNKIQPMVLAPPIHEFTLLIPPTKKHKYRDDNLSDLINSELSSIKMNANDAYDLFNDSSSFESDGFDSIFKQHEVGRKKNEDSSDGKSKNKHKNRPFEEIYGHVLMSFFPVEW